MPYSPAENRYEKMIYNRCGRSGLKLPAISLGLWHNFGDDTPHRTKRAIVPQGLRSRHHAFRSRQQLRSAARLGGDRLRRDPADGFRRLSRRTDHLDQGRLRDVGRALRRMGRPQVRAGQPRPEPEADGARLCRHLLFAPLRSRHAAGRNDGRARSCGALRQGALCRHLVLQFAAHARGSRHPEASSARPASSISRATRCSTAGSRTTGCSTRWRGSASARSCSRRWRKAC